ncbi:hypothetical protein Q3G72_000679 [Acer saccharum]|nr:hypothetical protein Q3G72_000679 [Acer saccharum]
MRKDGSTEKYENIFEPDPDGKSLCEEVEKNHVDSDVQADVAVNSKMKESDDEVDEDVAVNSKMKESDDEVDGGC